jgi:hypothetical protein
MTIELIKNTSMSDFISKSKWEQYNFISKVDISELRVKDQLPLLKKFIAMKVLMEARKASTNHSPFNLTAGFRDFLANIMPDLNQKAYGGQTSDDFMYPDEKKLRDDKSNAINSYRLFHISEMGAFIWNRKFFKVAIDEDNNIITQKANTHRLFSITAPTNLDHPQTWDKLNDAYHLKLLFKEIKKETRYDNTLGYDLASVAFFCTNTLLGLCFSIENWRILLVPLALALSVVVHALVLPVALALIAMEVMIVKPLELLVEAFSPDEHAEFIDEVTSPALAI